MTKLEYMERQNALETKLLTLGRWALAGVFGPMLAMMPLSAYLEDHKELHWLDQAGAICMLVFTWGAIGIVGWRALRLQRAHGLRCPNCGRRIMNRQLAVASGNCGYCGKKLFDEPVR